MNNNNWRNNFFNNSLCEGNITSDSNGNINVNGKLKDNVNGTVRYWAANPPTKSYSHAGSNLPYSSPEVAFQNSNNTGLINTTNGEFSLKLNYPNSYYVGLGSLYVPPTLYLKVCNQEKVESIVLGPGIPYRTLVHPAPPTKNNRITPLFYRNKNLDNMDARTQEKILRDSQYPEFNVIPPAMPDNFWGLKPPV